MATITLCGLFLLLSTFHFRIFYSFITLSISVILIKTYQLWKTCGSANFAPINKNKIDHHYSKMMKAILVFLTLSIVFIIMDIWNYRGLGKIFNNSSVENLRNEINEIKDTIRAENYTSITKYLGDIENLYIFTIVSSSFLFMGLIFVAYRLMKYDDKVSKSDLVQYLNSKF